MDIFLGGVVQRGARSAQEREDATAAEISERVLGLAESFLLAAEDVLPDAGLGSVAKRRQVFVAEGFEALAGVQACVREEEAERGEVRTVGGGFPAEGLRGQLGDQARGPAGS